MNVSAISAISTNECSPRKNLFIRYSNSFMSSPEVENPIEKANTANPIEPVVKTTEKMGIENLEEFTIFPKEVKEGQTIITA